MTLMKAARLGFSKCLIATIGSYACNDPCSVILLVPTDDDARRYAVDEVEPSFEESPALHDLIQRGRLDGRNTLVMKAFNAGGSLKILAARAPRNLRMHDAKVLLIDEADAMEIAILSCSRKSGPSRILTARSCAGVRRRARTQASSRAGSTNRPKRFLRCHALSAAPSTK